MSAIHLAQVANRIKDQFAEFIDRGDLSESDPEVDMKILSRCLAAHAVFMRSGCTEVDAARAVTDGGDDHGLDAIYFSPTTEKLFLVQSKWIRSGRGEPESGDVAKFCAGVRDLINLEKDRFNSKIQAKWDLVDKAVTSFGTRYELIIIYTGINTLAGPSTQLLDDLVDELNDAEPVVTFSALNQTRIYASLASGVSGDPIELEIALSNWGMTDSPHKAYYGAVTGAEVAQWWKDNGDNLFATNLRKMLGATEVNREIRATIDHRPEDFWYFNNGVTIVASTVTKSMVGGASREIGTFKVSDASVVNGAQTVSTIGKYTASGRNLEHVKIPLRIISLEHAGDQFGFEVTRANNRQNRIESRDFVAQDPDQLRLKTELALENINYNLARSESFDANDKAFDLAEATAALACLNPDSGLAVQAKREIGRFWADLSKAPYKTIFNPTVNGITVYRAVVVLREIEACLLSTIKGLGKRSGRDYGVLVHGNRLIESLVFAAIDARKVTDVSRPFDIAAEAPTIELNTTKMIGFLTSEVERLFPGGFLATVFKNPAKSKQLYQSCLALLSQPEQAVPTQDLFDL